MSQSDSTQPGKLLPEFQLFGIGRPQSVFIGMIPTMTRLSILVAGCRSGETGRYFARSGHTVTAIGLSPDSIEVARLKSQEQKLPITFHTGDFRSLKELPPLFDYVVDSGMFQGLSDSDRVHYSSELFRVMKPGGTLFLLCLSDEEPGTHGPRRVTRDEINAAFSVNWQECSIRSARFEIRPADWHPGFQRMFSPGGPKAWLAAIWKDNPDASWHFPLWYIQQDFGFQIIQLRKKPPGFEMHEDLCEEGEPVIFSTEVEAKSYCQEMNSPRFSPESVEIIVHQCMGYSFTRFPHSTA